MNDLTPPPTPPLQPIPPIQEGCNLIGVQSLMVQSLIGFLALCSLFVKRHYEYPKRKMYIFVLDVLKQVCSGFLIHFINVVISIVITAQHKKIGDQCATYLTSSILDMTVGIGLMSLIF